MGIANKSRIDKKYFKSNAFSKMLTNNNSSNLIGSVEWSARLFNYIVTGK